MRAGTAFIGNPPQSAITLASGRAVWLYTIPVKCPAIFSGNMQYWTDGPAIITVYAYNSDNEIDGTATPIDFDLNSTENKVYSGISNGCSLIAAEQTIDAGAMAVGDSVFFITNFRYPTRHNYTVNGSNTIKEILEIELTGNNKGPASIDNPDERLNNLANWSLRYYFAFPFTNTSMKKKKITCAIKTTDVDKKFPIIVSANMVYYAVISTNPAFAPSDTFVWDTFEVSPGETIHIEYTSILGTNSTHCLEHHFTVVSEE